MNEKGRTLVIQPDKGESYRQPVRANGHVELHVSERLRLVNAQVQLSPGSTPRFFDTVLAHVPLAGAEHLEPGRVDHDMSRLSCWCRLQSRFDAGLATTQGRVRRHWEIHVHQSDDGLEEALRRAQAEVEDRSDDQDTLDTWLNHAWTYELNSSRSQQQG